MTSLDIDPLLRKGLKLLHSRHKDSAEQLKALLDEATRQRQGKSLSSMKDPFNPRRESPIPRAKQSSPSNITFSKSNDLKRELSHKGRDDDSIGPHAPKRPKLDSPHNPFKSHTPSPTPSIKSESSSRSRKSDESDSDADMNELTSGLGINCTVCNGFEQTPGNHLVECQECHSLFHQECHKPPVSHQDVTADPRLVWYCSKCSRTLKKQSSLVASSSSSSSSLVGIRAASSSSSSISSSTKNIVSMSSSAPRPSPTKSIGLQRPSPFTNLSSVSRSNIGTGNSSNSNSSSSSSSSSNSRNNISSSSTRSNSSAPPSANSLMNAERRVHLMKKKAAAKNAERRKI